MGNHLPAEAELLTTAQVAELTGWSVTSINRWALNRELPYEHKLPCRTGAYLFRRDVVLSHLEDRKARNAA